MRDTPDVTISGWAVNDPDRLTFALTPDTVACGACGAHAPAAGMDADGDPLCARCVRGGGATRPCRGCQWALAPADVCTPPGDPWTAPAGVWCEGCVGAVCRGR